MKSARCVHGVDWFRDCPWCIAEAVVERFSADDPFTWWGNLSAVERRIEAERIVQSVARHTPIDTQRKWYE